MVVLTEKGFIHLSGCYEVSCSLIGDTWYVNAVWGPNAGAQIYAGKDEGEARRIADGLSRMAWGDASEGERRVDVREL